MRNVRGRYGARTLFIVVAVLVMRAGDTRGITVISTAPGTTVQTGVGYAALEFNNPLSGSEVLDGCPVAVWADAGYACDSTSTPQYEDWSVNTPCTPCPGVGCIDGYANEIWLRQAGHSARATVTTWAGDAITIHLHGDSNDGRVGIGIDFVQVAEIDMYTTPGSDNALVRVDGLAPGVHTIEVVALGPGAVPGSDDAAVMGAAVLRCQGPFWKGGGLAAPGPDVDQKQPGWDVPCGSPPVPTFTWCGPAAVADALVWQDLAVCPGLIPARLRLPSGDVDMVALTDEIGFQASGGGPGCAGTSVGGLMGAAWGYLKAAPCDYRIYSIPVAYDTLCAEVRLDHDAIVLLGFYQSNGGGLLSRVGGHFVSVAGCGSWNGSPAVAVSDPYWDSAAVGASGGRFAGPHGDPRQAPSDVFAHNNIANYSHDILDASSFSPLCPVLGGYDDPQPGPFNGQNEGMYTTREGCVLPPGSYTLVDSIFVIALPDSVQTGTGDVPGAGVFLSQNVPNPFNPITRIAFRVRRAGRTRLTVYDAAGRRVATLVDGWLGSRSEYHAVWRGRDSRGHGVASGVYFYRLVSPGVDETRRMVLIR